MNETAIFGGGCFWCTEAVFKMLRGVNSVTPGYAGGTTANPTYDEVCEGNTGHAEVVKIEFDPAIIGYDKLLTVFFGSHDPTTVNRQGNDVGTQYRSVIFYTTSEQKKIAEDFIKEINTSNADGKTIATELVEFDPLSPGKFYPAETYHQDYYNQNKNQVYCQIIINPKLEKVQKKFADLLKENEL